MALLDWAGECSRGRQKHQFKTVCDALPTNLEVSNVASGILKKQKPESTNHAKYSKLKTDLLHRRLHQE
jgi:hypothetical protein